MQRSVGNGAMSNSIVELEDTDCIFVFGYNAADSHPIVARRILHAKAKGAKSLSAIRVALKPRASPTSTFR
ncbi:molybdopterin-dependent oxidoreductase [Edwardsiella anguillarum]|nr:molybdopterin-dependent oxidoreductase [Edwardsiella anguillarum]